MRYYTLSGFSVQGSGYLLNRLSATRPPFEFYLWFFFFNDTATTEIYTLSLHDALPILRGNRTAERSGQRLQRIGRNGHTQDRKSTRLNSSHLGISYAVFCLKKKNT